MPDGPDTRGVGDALASMADHVASAAEAARAVATADLPAGAVDGVLIVGLGGARTAAEVTAAVAGGVCPVPVVAHAGVAVPGWVGRRAVVVAVSDTGDDPEVVEVFEEAARRRARLVALAPRGPLTGIVDRWGGLPLAAPGLPERFGALPAAATVITLLERVGLCPGGSDAVATAVQALNEPPWDRAREVARTIGRRLPLCYGGNAVGRVAARHWRDQLAATAKVLAWAAALPEAAHDHVAAFGQHGDITRQVNVSVVLRHDAEHPLVAARFAPLTAILEEVTASVVEVAARGDGPAAQLFDLVRLGDAVACQLAWAEGLDPGPAPAVEELRAVR